MDLRGRNAVVTLHNVLAVEVLEKDVTCQFVFHVPD